MSTRALRKAEMGKAVVGAGAEESEEEDAPPRPNAFALLQDSDHSPEEHDPPPVIAPFQPESSKPKKKKKGKKKAKKAAEETDIDAIIAEVTAGDISAPSKALDLEGHSSRADLMTEAELFKIEHRCLNPANELRRILGSAINEKDFRRLAGSGASSSRGGGGRGGKLVEASRGWPPPTRTGLSMSLVSPAGASPAHFRFHHSREYQEAQLLFVQGVEVIQPDTFMAILQSNHYHIDSLLQMSDIYRANEDYTQSRDFIQRAIYAYWAAFHPLFNVTTFNCRLDYAQAENRSFFLALWRHLQALLNRGCSRTALEFSKLIYSLDPRNDPLGIMLIMDFLALRSRQFGFLVQLFQGLEVSRNLSQLPNFNYSVALAHFLRAQDEEGPKAQESLAAADAALQIALTRFPSLLHVLLDRCSVEPDKEVAKVGIFGAAELSKDSRGLHQLYKLYAFRTVELWKDAAVMGWVERNVRALLPALSDSRAQDAHPVFKEFRAKRRHGFKAVPRNVLRHMVISELGGELRVNLAGELADEVMRSHDPIPPRDSRCDYDLAERAAGPAGTNGFLDGLVRSLLPSYTPETAAQADAAAAAAGEDGELRGSVQGLMNAMRELLANIQVEGPQREDGEVENDQEWEDWD